MTISANREAGSYKPPDYLIRTQTQSAWFPVLVILAGISVAGLLGMALFVADQFVYIYILYNALIGFAIGRVIAQAPKRSNYANRGVLLGVTVLCSALVYLVFSVAIYLLVFDGAEADAIDNWANRIGHFMGILTLRAANEPFLFGIQPGVAGSLAVWAAEFGITFYVAWSQVSAAIRLRHPDNTSSEAELGGSLSQATPATKYFWRVLWLVYATILVSLSYEIVIDEIAIGTNIPYLAMTLFIDVVGVAGLIFYAFKFQPARIKRVWQSVFPILFANEIIVVFVESPPDELTAFEWVLMLLFGLLLLLPIYYANYRLAYKDIFAPRGRRKAKTSKSRRQSIRDPVCAQERFLAKHEKDRPHSPAAWVIVGLSLTLSSAASFARDGDDLLSAAFDGDLPQVRTLLTQGAEVDFQGFDGWTALLIASQEGNDGIVQALLAQGAAINHQKKGGHTALIVASQNGHQVTVRTLLDEGADIDIQDTEGSTALKLASWQGHEGIVRTLLAEGADINIQDEIGYTALMVAAQQGHEGNIQTLLDNGAQIDHQGKDGATALMLSAQNGHEGNVRVLLAEGATINHQGKILGQTALMAASKNGHEWIVRALLDEGADINIQDTEGSTALTLASWQGHEGIVRTLLAEGADINIQDKYGYTALMLAAQDGHEDNVQTLLDNGAQIDHQGQDGATALMLSSQNGHTGIVKALLAKGANVHLKLNNGRTALDLARTRQIKRTLKAVATQ